MEVGQSRQERLDDNSSHPQKEELTALIELLRMGSFDDANGSKPKHNRQNSLRLSKKPSKPEGAALNEDRETREQTIVKEAEIDPFFTAASFYSHDASGKTPKNGVQANETSTKNSEKESDAGASMRSFYTDTGMIDLNMALGIEQEEVTIHNPMSTTDSVFPNKFKRLGPVSKDKRESLLRVSAANQKAFDLHLKNKINKERKSGSISNKGEITFSSNPSTMMKQVNIPQKKLEAFDPLHHPTIPIIQVQFKRHEIVPEVSQEEQTESNCHQESNQIEDQAESLMPQAKPLPPKTYFPRLWHRPSKTLQLSIITEQEEKASIDASTSGVHQLSMSRVTTPRRSIALVKSELEISGFAGRRPTTDHSQMRLSILKPEEDEKEPTFLPPIESVLIEQEISPLVSAAELFLSKPPTQQSRLLFTKAVIDAGLMADLHPDAVKIVVSMAQVELKMQTDRIQSHEYKAYFMVLAGEATIGNWLSFKPGQVLSFGSPNPTPSSWEGSIMASSLNNFGNYSLSSKTTEELDKVSPTETMRFRQGTVVLRYGELDLKRIRQLCTMAGQKDSYGRFIDHFEGLLEQTLWRELQATVGT
jgi:hypothetical protein